MKRLSRAALAAGLIMAVATPALAWQDGWSFRTKITVNPGQAGVTSTIGAQPVLIRLHSGNFAFADAKPDGSDLRIFAGDDSTALPFQIERWDRQGEVALVWVRLPEVTAGATPIYLYYGKADATAAANPAQTFQNRALVWHFAEGSATEASAPQDSSSARLNGGGAAPRNVNGLIGQSLRLDGSTGISVPQQALPGGTGSVSMWVKPAAADANGAIFTSGDLTLSLANGVPTITAGDRTAAAQASIAPEGWTHLALVADQGRVALYVNGQPAGQIEAALPAAAAPGVLGQGFAGEIDEFQIAREALPAGAIALAAGSQGAGARLLAFERPEQVEEGGHGYFGILLNALTPDAWAVIILLAIMSFISWWVMITKGVFLARTAAANDEFLESYEKASTGQSDHDGLADIPSNGKTAQSSLAHLYRIGQRELQRRIAEGRASGSRYAVRAQSIAAIRSALDAGQVRESQRLNKWMVLLTIAISGGPFLGLLGTVVGVMITFAAVAAAGDVNINAIAPGIAAALLATVAGLAVAIPALFGYNYLLSRVGEIDADNQIFVDELEKRIAETYQDTDRPAPPPSRTAVAAE